MAIAKQLSEKNIVLKSIRMVLVWCFLSYLRLFAKIALIIHRPVVIGIAGAVGKSTAKEALRAILPNDKSVRAIEGNSESGIPLGILGLDHGTYSVFDWLKAIVLSPFSIGSLKEVSYLLVEYGIDGPFAPKNMGYLLTIVTPDIAMLLNESPAHVGKYDAIVPKKPGIALDEKLQAIVEYMTKDDGKMLEAKTVTLKIINADDPNIVSFAQKKFERGSYATVGKSEGSDVAVLDSFVSTTGTELSFAIHTHQVKENVHIIIPGFALPKETATLLGSVILTGIHLNIPVPTIVDRLQTNFMLPPGRGTILSGKNESIIIDSSYNASSASVLSFLGSLSELKKETKRPTVFLFGDMLELGEYAPMEHNLVSKELVGVVDHLILVGPTLQHLVLPYAEKKKAQFKTVSWFPTAKEAGTYLASMIPKSAIVFVKGSQTLEEAIKLVLVNAEDKSRLCRQDAFWEASKKKRDQWVD